MRQYVPEFTTHVAPAHARFRSAGTGRHTTEFHAQGLLVVREKVMLRSLTRASTGDHPSHAALSFTTTRRVSRVALPRRSGISQTG